MFPEVDLYRLLSLVKDGTEQILTDGYYHGHC